MINKVSAFRPDHTAYGGAEEDGSGCEGSRYALEKLTHPKLVCWRV